jgi:hypothetical protein
MKQYQSGGRGCDQTDSRTVEQCADYWRCRQERKTHQQTRAEANDQYCVGGVLDLGLALDEGLRQGAVHGLGQGTRSSPIRPRRRRPRGGRGAGPITSV